MTVDEFKNQIKNIDIRTCVLCQYYEFFDNHFHSGYCNYNNEPIYTDIYNVCDFYKKKVIPREFMETYNCHNKANPDRNCSKCVNFNLEGTHKAKEGVLLIGQCKETERLSCFLTTADSRTICDLFKEVV